MRAEIVSIGTELLMGEIVDTNSAYLSSELPKLGIELRWVSKVSDDPEQMAEVLGRAWGRSDLTLMTGGLGPTSDDLTRETIARILGEQMAVQDDLLRHLKAQFASFGIPMPENNIKQATLIPSSKAVANPIGTAPGWWVEKGGRIAVAMPGPPRELKRMWVNEVVPRLKEKSQGAAIVTKTWKTFGISEGSLNQMLAPLFDSKNPIMGIYARPDGIHLRAIATAPDTAKARTLIEPMDAQVRQAAGHAIWGLDDDTPESLVAERLATRRLTLGTMECHTGGLLVNALTVHPAMDKLLRGGIVVPNAALLESQGVPADLLRQHGPASAQAAEAMAQAARTRLGAGVGLAITGIQSEGTGEDPVQVCHAGYDIEGKRSSLRLRYPSRLMIIKERVVVQALLELLRLLK
jgi:nicotinamide-nucleotide amidase